MDIKLESFTTETYMKGYHTFEHEMKNIQYNREHVIFHIKLHSKFNEGKNSDWNIRKRKRESSQTERNKERVYRMKAITVRSILAGILPEMEIHSHSTAEHRYVTGIVSDRPISTIHTMRRCLESTATTKPNSTVLRSPKNNDLGLSKPLSRLNRSPPYTLLKLNGIDPKNTK